MEIFRHKNFIKQYKKLGLKQQNQVDKAVQIFFNDPFDLQLRNHELKGRFKECRSIDAGFDLRIIFEEQNDYVVVIMLMVGTHSQLY